MRDKFSSIMSCGVLFFLVFVSCSPKLNKRVSDDTITIFPPPPDTTRIQFLTSISNSIDVTGKRSGFKTFILGKKESEPIIKPYGLTIFKGKIYICDTMLGGLEIIDLQKRTFDYFKPAGLGQLKKPINCAVDSSGNLYVADSERKQMVFPSQA